MDDSFVLVRTFNAPKEPVFKAFSTAAALNTWWAPVETIGYSRFTFGQVIPPDLIEFTNSLADEKVEASLPDKIFYRIAFAENKGKTTIMLTGNPVGGSPEQIAGFESISLDLHKGFDETLNKLAEHLKKK